MRTIRILLPVVPSVLIVLVLMMFARQLFPSEIMQEDIDVWGAYFAVFGVIYAIVVGFIFIRVYDRFHEIGRTILDGLSTVANIRDYLVYVDKNQETKREIRRCLFDYVRLVVKREWMEMEYTVKRQTSSDTSPELYRLMETVHQIKVTNESDLIALDVLIRKIGELSALRTRRLELSDEQLAPILRFLILFMSVTLAVGTILMNVESVWMHGLIVFSITGAVHILYIMISELNHPFAGYWQIDISPYTEISNRLEKELKAVKSRESHA